MYEERTTLLVIVKEAFLTEHVFSESLHRPLKHIFLKLGNALQQQ